MTDPSAHPRVIGDRYVLQSPLGTGGMGVVYKALDRQLWRTVALKLLKPELRANTLAERRFEREALAAARVSHPNIVRVLEFGREAQDLYLVMEHLSGETLKDRIVGAGPVPVSLAIALHLQLLDALAAAHSAGILHRDVKPANVFLTPLADGAVLVKLLDFGIAAFSEAGQSEHRLTFTGMAIGSPAYMAPERLDGLPADPRTDVYSVGVCLYESLIGEPPSRFRHPVDHARELMERRPDLPYALRAAVVRAMARDPDARFASAEAMAGALWEALGEPMPPLPHRASGLSDTRSGTVDTRPEPHRRNEAHRSSEAREPTPQPSAEVSTTSGSGIVSLAVVPRPSTSSGRWLAGLLGLLVGVGAATATASLFSTAADASVAYASPSTEAAAGDVDSNRRPAPAPSSPVTGPVERVPPPAPNGLVAPPTSLDGDHPPPRSPRRPRAPVRSPLRTAPSESAHDLIDNRHELMRPAFRAP